MCLISLLYEEHAEHRLVLAANRDEFFARPTLPAHRWREAPHLVAGRDLRGGGTWMGCTQGGRFCAITNYRDPAEHRDDVPSRGGIVSGFLTSTLSARSFAKRLRQTRHAYNAYNLLLMDEEELVYLSSIQDRIEPLSSGLYGLSNEHLDTPWPKVTHTRTALRTLASSGDIREEALFKMLRNETKAEKDRLPDTGVDPELEHALSSVFIATPSYGTRASSVVLVDYAGHISFSERTFDARGDLQTSRAFRLNEKHIAGSYPTF